MPLFSCKRNEMANGLTGIPTGIFPGSHQDSRRNPSPIILCCSSFPIPHPGGCFGDPSLTWLPFSCCFRRRKMQMAGGKCRRQTDGAAHKDTCCAYTYTHAHSSKRHVHTHTRDTYHATPPSDKLEIGVERSRPLFHSRIAIKKERASLIMKTLKKNK